MFHSFIPDLTGFKNLLGLKPTVAFLLFSFVFFSSCKKNKSENVVETIAEEQTAQTSFSRKDLLTNLADNLIYPSLSAFSNQSDTLYSAVLIFVDNPTQSKLDSLQDRLTQTSLAWQNCGWFRFASAKTQFGSVDAVLKYDQINTFPVAATKIEAYIAAADYSLANTDYDTRGLGTIDYLIYPLDGKDSLVLARFSQSANRKAYLKALALAIRTRANVVKNAWATDRIAYLAATGTDGYSSASLTTLDMNVDFENIKNFKVGVPVGRVIVGLSDPLNPLPDKAEAFYSGNSVKYLRANIKAIEHVWRGRSFAGIEGIGFDDYLNANNAASLSQAITSQFNLVYTKLDAIPEGRLSETIKTNKQPVQDLYVELQKLTNYLKDDMVSQLGLSITFASGDGD